MNNNLGSSSLTNRVNKPFRPPFKTPGPAKTTETSNNLPQIKPLQSTLTTVTNQPGTEKTSPQTPANLYYKAFYTKDVKKKNKSYKEGFLEITRFKIKIFDTDGKDVYDTARGRFFKEAPKEDEEYFLGSYLLQIETVVAPEEFTSGRCFLKNTNLLNTGPTLNKSGLLHKKIKIQQKTENQDIEIQVPEGAYMLNERNKEKSIHPCYIDPYLSSKMRIHQKEGIKFMFECIVGFKGQDITGCILADSMGLGKTLQTIGLIWTLAKQNPYVPKRPYVNKAVVLAPLSVVKNWEKEIAKWLGSTRMQPLVAMGEKDDVGKTIENFTQGNYRCLLTSYEVFMKHVEKLNNHCDLLILDEGHRLKNMENKIFQCFTQFNCKKRIILTGTPLQNKLEELYACCEFLNPGIFPNLATFRKVFINPILAGLKKNAKKDDQILARERSKELSKTLGSFILRRPASILQSILPPKHEYFVLLRLTEAQKIAYKKILNYKVYKSESEMMGDAFSVILVLRKLLNHPQLLYNDNSECGRAGVGSFPENLLQLNLWENSIKFQFTKDLIDNMKTGDKMIIVSYFTQTLDLIEKLCNSSNVKFLRLDGQVAAMKRQRLIDRFNDKTTDIKIFLLCGKAGGTGLNLTGANKMVLFEADWNPSNDNQVMGRIWRDGQKKEAKIYRLISCGTIEEKIMQRQFVKEDLSLNVVDERNVKSMFDTQDLKKIFKFENDTQTIVFEESENERDKIFELDNDFEANMKNYIVYIRKKVDVMNSAKKVAATNQFEEGNIFLEETKKAKEQDNGKEGEREENDDEDDDEAEEEKEDNEESDNEECYYHFSDEEVSKEEKEEKALGKESSKIEEPIQNKEAQNEQKLNDSEMNSEEEEESGDENNDGNQKDEEDLNGEDFAIENKMEIEKSSQNEEKPKGKILVNLNKQKDLRKFLPLLEDQNSTKKLEVEKEELSQQEKTDSKGKESQKRKAGTNLIGENILKKLKLI